MRRPTKDGMVISKKNGIIDSTIYCKYWHGDKKILLGPLQAINRARTSQKEGNVRVIIIRATVRRRIINRLYSAGRHPSRVLHERDILMAMAGLLLEHSTVYNLVVSWLVRCVPNLVLVGDRIIRAPDGSIS